jgi:hypothetical protein
MFVYFIQYCVSPSDSIVSKNAGIEAMTVATLALAVIRSYLSARSSKLVPYPNFFVVVCRNKKKYLNHSRLDIYTVSSC